MPKVVRLIHIVPPDCLLVLPTHRHTEFQPSESPVGAVYDRAVRRQGDATGERRGGGESLVILVVATDAHKDPLYLERPHNGRIVSAFRCNLVFVE